MSRCEAGLIQYPPWVRCSRPKQITTNFIKSPSLKKPSRIQGHRPRRGEQSLIPVKGFPCTWNQIPPPLLFGSEDQHF